MQTRTGTLQVPGARLYHEVRGSGPTLLFMPGGPADAGTMGKLAELLADSFTAVTYDPRGMSRSTLEGELDQSRLVETYADDAHRLLAAATRGNARAYVFSNSGGAVFALELAARHPEQIHTLVAHEPPSPVLQPHPAEVHAGMEEVVDLYRTAGLGAAIQRFMQLTRMRDGGEPPPAGPQGGMSPEMQEGMARMMRNMDLFLGPYMLAVAAYEPDFDALKKASCRVVAAVGAESQGELAHDGGLALARRLGMEAVVFPGAHGGFESHPVQFAKRLRQVLED